MIWFPIIVPYHHSDDYSGRLSREFREREMRINKRIKFVGTIFSVIGFSIFALMIIAFLFPICE